MYSAVCAPVASWAVGVGHILAKSTRVVPAWCLLSWLDLDAVAFAVFFESPAHGVGIGGKEPDALSAMGSSHVTGGEHAPASIVPSRRKVLENDAPIIERREVCHVFEEEPRRAGFSQDSESVRPEVSGVVLAESLAGAAESLAGDSTGHKVNCAPPGTAVEAS